MDPIKYDIDPLLKPSAENTQARYNKMGQEVFDEALAAMKQPETPAKKMPPFEPLNDFLLVRDLERDKQTPGGIVLVDSYEEDMHKGEVIKVPRAYMPPRINVNGTYLPGDVVYYRGTSGTKIRLEGEKYRIIRPTELFGKEPD